MGGLNQYRDNSTGGVGPAPAVPVADVVAALNAIRASVHHWIDAIEERLDREAQSPAAGRELEQAARELGQERDALIAVAERREREWADRLDALEHDRRLLAEAWERLERAQVDPALSPHGASCPSYSAPPAASPRPSIARDEPANPVDQAILRQFESLRRDVRRRSESQLP